MPDDRCPSVSIYKTQPERRCDLDAGHDGAHKCFEDNQTVAWLKGDNDA